MVLFLCYGRGSPSPPDRNPTSQLSGQGPATAGRKRLRRAGSNLKEKATFSAATMDTCVPVAAATAEAG